MLRLCQWRSSVSLEALQTTTVGDSALFTNQALMILPHQQALIHGNLFRFLRTKGNSSGLRWPSRVAELGFSTADGSTPHPNSVAVREISNRFTVIPTDLSLAFAFLKHHFSTWNVHIGLITCRDAAFCWLSARHISCYILLMHLSTPGLFLWFPDFASFLFTLSIDWRQAQGLLPVSPRYTLEIHLGSPGHDQGISCSLSPP